MAASGDPSGEDFPTAAWVATVATYQAATRLLERRLTNAGLSVAQFDTLSAVSDLGEATQQQVTDRVTVTKAGLGTMLTRLERDKLIKRRVDPVDGRARLVSLTRRGQVALEQAVACRNQVIDATVGALPPRDQRSLLRIMTALRHAVTEDNQD